MKHQRGIGLSEILVSIFLSSFIVIILMQHYLVVKKQYHHLQATLEQGIDLQLVIELLRNSSRKAGFTPCLSIDDLVTVDRRDRSNPLTAIDVSTHHNRLLAINRMSDRFDTVLQVESPTQLLMTALAPRHQGDSILIADCYHAEVQQVQGVVHVGSNQRIILNLPLAFDYHEPIYVGEWLEERYFIRQDKNGKGSLFYQHHHSEELTTAVHSLSAHIAYETGQRVIVVQLGLEDTETIVVETRVRAL